MRSIRVVGLALAISTAVPLAAQSNFEGVISFRAGREGLTNKDTGTVMVQTTKGSMLRVDMISTRHGQTGQGTIIVDEKTRMMTILMPEQHLYMVSPMPDLTGDSSYMSEYKDFTIDKTGRTETVAGVSCDVYRGTSTKKDGTKKVGEACLAKGVGFAMFGLSGGAGRGASAGNPAVEAFRKMQKEDLHMIKMSEEKDGKMVVVMEAVKIDRSSVPNSAFEVPAGYSKFEMPKGMGAPPKP